MMTRVLPEARYRTAAPVKSATISIIVPVLNEVRLIGRFVQHLRERAPAAEIIVADGGSSDGTREIAERLCDEFVVTDPGRSVQMNAGATAAGGETLWFLHVDAEIAAASVNRIREALDDSAVAGGYFRVRLPRPQLVYRLTDSFAHYAGMLLRIRCGDHGFFCRRSVFDAIGGIPAVGFMEDVEFFRAIARRGRVVAIEQRMIISPRRYEAVGPLRLTLAFGLIATLYAAGVPRRVLERLYNQLCVPARS